MIDGEGFKGATIDCGVQNVECGIRIQKSAIANLH
jgi:hypothetical protein